jgi:hypothetical protein
MPLALSKPTPSPDGSPPFAPGRKLGLVEIAHLWQLLDENPQCPRRVVLDKMAQRQLGASVSVRHLNRLRLKWNCNRPKGRPRRPVPSAPERDSAALIRLTPHMAAVGVHLLARWLDQQDSWRPLVAAVQQAIEAYQRDPRDADFALLHHREVTVQRRLAALILAPLLGIAHLSEFDTHEHPLETVIGRSYQSSTLSQFLGHLERIEAAATLMPLLLPSNTAEITYVDGHMTPYWSRLSMHKGKITMLGRIMAGSPALIAHNEAGQALWVAYYPPEPHLSQIIVTYCQQVVMVTGSDLFVIDRAVNSVAIAQAFNRAGACCACSMITNMTGSPALPPPRWASSKTAPGSMRDRGACGGLMIRGTLSWSSLNRVRPWCTGGHRGSETRSPPSPGPRSMGPVTRFKKTASSA